MRQGFGRYTLVMKDDVEEEGARRTHDGLGNSPASALTSPFLPPHLIDTLILNHTCTPSLGWMHGIMQFVDGCASESRVLRRSWTRRYRRWLRTAVCIPSVHDWRTCRPRLHGPAASLKAICKSSAWINERRVNLSGVSSSSPVQAEFRPCPLGRLAFFVRVRENTRSPPAILRSARTASPTRWMHPSHA